MIPECFSKHRVLPPAPTFAWLLSKSACSLPVRPSDDRRDSHNRLSAAESGSCSVDPHDEAAFPEVTAVLTAADFSSERHKCILLAMCELHEHREKIDRVTLANELTRRRQLESAAASATSFRSAALASYRQLCRHRQRKGVLVP
jgi:hypothetical protein